MKELVVISGKGGTGKTTITACFAALAERQVLADADVDAADLFILLNPEIKQREEFRSGAVAKIDHRRCTQCGECIELCRFEAIMPDFRVDPVDCEGCAVCARFCPAEAIQMQPCVSGEWYISDTRYGPFVHAKLGVGEENSGKLVTVVRHHARLIAEECDLNWIIVDGPPGIGCPVISSLTGSDAVLIVTEPTLSGIHDMKRVSDLAAYFRVPKAVCINKWDLNGEISQEIADYCRHEGMRVVGKIPYDRIVTEALVQRKILVEYDPLCSVSQEIKGIWEEVQGMVGSQASQVQARERYAGVRDGSSVTSYSQEGEGWKTS
jgi:MinD superfamily P-loop ATPase